MPKFDSAPRMTPQGNHRYYSRLDYLSMDCMGYLTACALDSASFLEDMLIFAKGRKELSVKT
jgi:hypothetical protein